MNWEHFRAFLWLRWRLLINQLRRGGTANAVILGVLLILVAFFSVGLGITFLFVGASALSSASSGDLLLVWDGLVVAFLFFWMMGLLLELQRSEVLSLDKLLHLPVSLHGAFIINYLSSLFSVSLAAFLPAMIALTIGLAVDRGPVMLLQLPLLAAFILMVTALTYQFQGWLASLMANPRRRRTVIVVVTMAFILLAQLPNLLNITRSRQQPRQDDTVTEKAREETELQKERDSGKIDKDEYTRRLNEIKSKYQKRADEAEREQLNRVEGAVRVYNIALPPGWLPLGAADAADGRVLPALLGILGMGAIGAVSLWRSYRTTVRLYTGQFTSGKRKAVPAPAAAPSAPDSPGSVGLLERQLPGVSERASIIALSGFRSLLRAPEAKMLLLSPVILVLVFGSLYSTRSTDLPEAARPLAAFGGMSVILLSMGQIAGNQFGLDRAGFRVFVLSAAPRRDILIGKNLALAPIALVLGLVMVILVEVLQPLRIEHLLAVLPEFVCMYVPYCLMANFLSIIAPMAIRSGSFKAYQPKGTTILLHIVFALLCPLLMIPALLPLGIEFVLEHFGWLEGLPVCLVLSLLEAVAMIGLYRLFVGLEGDLLQAHEKRILDIVTARTE